MLTRLLTFRPSHPPDAQGGGRRAVSDQAVYFGQAPTRFTAARFRCELCPAVWVNVIAQGERKKYACPSCAGACSIEPLEDT